MKTAFAIFGVFHFVFDLSLIFFLCWWGREARIDREKADAAMQANEKRPFAG